MNSFHRTKRESRWLTFVGLSVVFVVSVAFMLIGFVGIGANSGIDVIRLIFGIIGVALFVGFFRGFWMTTGGAVTHVFSINDAELEWGLMGREKRLPVGELASVYWDETDGFTLMVTRKDGTRVRFPYIESVVPMKSRGQLLAFLRVVHPKIPISGRIHPQTEQDADVH